MYVCISRISESVDMVTQLGDSFSTALSFSTGTDPFMAVTQPPTSDLLSTLVATCLDSESGIDDGIELHPTEEDLDELDDDNLFPSELLESRKRARSISPVKPKKVLKSVVINDRRTTDKSRWQKLIGLKAG